MKPNTYVALVNNSVLQQEVHYRIHEIVPLV